MAGLLNDSMPPGLKTIQGMLTGTILYYHTILARFLYTIRRMEAVTKRSKKFRGEEPQQGILVRSRVTKMEGLVASPFFICINAAIGRYLSSIYFFNVMVCPYCFDSSMYFDTESNAPIAWNASAIGA